ncbi:MAG: GNAT family N-acetyltransferase [Candidatus Omnitrophica bacterium]|nr:GNAT family N-acetyltransferase [Candidatus Omnitrophota bacterium]
MRVRAFQDIPADARDWDAYVATHERATSDHLWGWRRVLSEAFTFRPYYLGAIEGGRLAGILPLFQVPRGFGVSAFSSIPFGNYGGICADSDGAACVLLEAAKELVHQTAGAYLDLRHRVPVSDGGLAPQRLYSRFTLPLLGNPALHWRQLGSNNRKKLSKARRLGLRIVTSREAGWLYPIHAHTARRLGTPCFPRRYFELILEQFPSRSELSFVASSNRLLAYELGLRFKESLVIQLAGALSSHLKCHLHHLLLWDMIERGCQQGLRELDYCRSRVDSGSAQFKRGLHLREEPLSYQYYLPQGRPLPQRHPSNPTYRLAIAIWKRLPVALTRLLGPTLVRYLA